MQPNIFMLFKCLIFVVNSSDNVSLNTDSAPIISPFQAIPYVLISVEVIRNIYPSLVAEDLRSLKFSRLPSLLI